MQNRQLIGCVLTLLVAMPISVRGADRPNILLIMADDVGSDAIGCYGGQSYPTPHIDKLAAGGLKFSHAFSMPVCHPTRICLMTGRYPFRFGEAGSQWGDFPDEAEELSIGHRMRQAGYSTAVAGKWQLCLMKDDLDHPRRTGFDEWCLFGWHEGGRYHDPLIYQNGVRRTDTTGRYGPDIYVEFLVDFMRRSHNADTPFFAYYPMALCHDVTDDLNGELVAFATDGRWMTFGEMMASMDDRVGRLIAALEHMGIRDDTLIIFTTDNGTAAASYSRLNADGRMIKEKVFSIRNGEVVPGGKGKTDDTGTRVPLIAYWPGRIEPGTETAIMVDFTDLLPTLADLAKLPPEEVPRDGVSFAPTLLGTSGQEPKRDWICIEHRGERCVRSLNAKLYGDGRFFDLTTDPLESFPLSDQQLSGDTRPQRAELHSALNSLHQPLNQDR